MRILSNSVSDTKHTANKLARLLNPGDIICLFGKLGSGKTVFAKGVASGLGIKQDQVISPSFVIMRRHLEGKLPLFHFDLYRLGSYSDIFSLGLDEYFYSQGVIVVEWAQRLKKVMPAEFLKIVIDIKAKNKRELNISARGSRFRKLMEKLGEDPGD